MKRNFAMDAIRILLTALVVFHHTTIVYGGSGSWYWREEPNASNTWMVAFNCINQSFFMGFFFLLAGYYTRAARGHKSIAMFLGDRVLRLGVPLIVFYFLLSPLTVALAQMSGFGEFPAALGLAFNRHEFGPGPLWFVVALLAMSLVYLLFEPWVSRFSLRQVPAFSRMLPVLLGLGLVSFGIRLVIPVGQNWLWMQWGYFAPYIFLFALGVLSFESHLLVRIQWRDCRFWLLVSGLALILLAWVLVFGLGEGSFDGGWNINALFYALWDPLFSAGVILGLLWGAHQIWCTGEPSRLLRFLARRSYLIYILHAPVLVAWSRLFAEWSLAPVTKLLLVGCLSFFSAALLGDLLLRLPYASRVL